MIGVEKCKTPDTAFYRSDAVTHLDVKVADLAKAAHQLASFNSKFLAKFNYATDYNDNIMDMELSDDLLEFLYPALIEGHEKLVQKKQKREEEICRTRRIEKSILLFAIGGYMDYIYDDILDALSATDDTDNIADYVNKIESGSGETFYDWLGNVIDVWDDEDYD